MTVNNLQIVNIINTIHKHLYSVYDPNILSLFSFSYCSYWYLSIYAQLLGLPDDDLYIKVTRIQFIVGICGYIVFLFYSSFCISKIYIGGCESLPCCHIEINRYKQCV